MLVLGIDPGVQPAMALYAGPDQSPVVYPPMGITHSAKKGGKTVMRADPDIPAILDIFDTYCPELVAIENVNSMPGQGISSTARFMHATGVVTGIAYGKRCRVTKVRPNEWQRAFKMPVGDDVSRQVCIQLFPWMSKQFALKKSHNESDALLIAVYIWHLEMGQPMPQC